ncbi:MAG: ATP-binding protein [Acidobacteriota bacterium]
MLGCPRELALAHLLLKLRPLHRALRTAVMLRDTSARELHAAGAIGTAITHGHAGKLLDQLADLAGHRSVSAGRAVFDVEEQAVESQLRERATATARELPLDALKAGLGLDDFECEVLVLCAAVELDGEYERLFAYVHDDVARRVASVELACALTAGSLQERVERRVQLASSGRLRRLGLVACTPHDTGLRDELRLTPSCLQALLGVPVDVSVTFRDTGEIRLVRPGVVPADPALVARAAHLLAERRLDIVAVWGRAALARDIVAVLADDAGLTVRRHVTGAAIAAEVATAAALGAALWIDLDEAGEGASAELADVCATTTVPMIVTANHPWRPTGVLAARRCVEIAIATPDHAARVQLWQAELPDVPQELVEQLSSTFHFDATEVRAAGMMARSLAALHTNGHVVTPADSVRTACLSVARKHGERHMTLVVPRRRAEDLVLPAELHARVLDLVHNFRALPRVMDDWGFSSRVSGSGLKGLFTGEPGTGKTLAAEVVANELGLPMLRVDLARVVSKWIGETEKNLDQVFNEARDSHALLFFDEAEALFGARGDVRHGTDRYANLEVSYLLQRFEDHSGIVILATNLRDKIDPAFMRRFHVVVGFPRPAEKERRRIWQRVFTPALPVADDLDVAVLARLDMTGAGIVGAAQSAALLAARENGVVTMRHVVRGLVRQYQREARVLSPHDLGPHAIHVTA